MVVSDVTSIPSSASNCENRLRVNFQAMKAMAPSAASPPATERPMIVLVETPEPPLEFWLGGLSAGGEGVGVSVKETTTSLVIVVTWPSSCVLAICVLLVLVRTICDAEGEVLVCAVGELDGGVEGGWEVDAGGMLVVDAEIWRNL